MTDYSLKNILNIYMQVFIHFLNKCLLIQFNQKNHKLLTYYILRGHDMLTNIFSILLNKYKNIDITFDQCQKACHLYIEFIEQITHEQNTFLNLTSRDAILYVYKQCIFDIPDIIPSNIHFNQTFQYIYSHTIICNKILEIYLKTMHIDKNHVKQITTLCEKIFNAEWNTLNIEIIESLLESFYCSNLNSQTFYDTFNSILKKTKHPFVLSNIKKKLIHEDILNHISNKNFVDWICN